MKRFLVTQAQIAQTSMDEQPSPPLKDGEARAAIRRFALTANNVTYAASGFAIGYWSFFPTGIDGQGLVPVWGFAEVVESRSDDLTVGTRLYGFWPPAEELVMLPERTGKVVTDRAPHRAELPPVYNRYVEVREGEADAEGVQALLQPLLATSYLISDWLQDNAFFEAEQVIVGSSSSKTGLGLCAYLSEIADRPVKVVGLTSDRNRAFVEGLGTCDQVVTYDDIETLDRVPSVYVDMAGNADVKQRLHAHFDDLLRHSAAVGTSHWDQFNPKQVLAGPRPQFFFAPAQIEKRRADWGPGEIERRISAAWKRLAADAGSWMELRHHTGIDAVGPVYDALASGRANPRDGHVITL
ncbi:DUF2855 family protein [Shimia biformata]|uniref:DUF2855 family protein n=1 Tax=Shimia biformata TaxID=1294299 RepID=UPI0019514CF8|nr:DUF2855 family protein [Shimia biformata]